MPASQRKQVYNFKGNFVAACQSILDAYGWTDVFIEREFTKLKCAARKEITFDLGEALNQDTLENGEKVYDFYRAMLRLRIVTGRRAEQSSAVPGVRDLHDQFVCEALDAFEERRAPFTTDNLPYYAVKIIRPLGTKTDLDLVYFEDTTSVDFELQFGIRSTAWPV